MFLGAASRFTNGEIILGVCLSGCVTVFSPNDISRLRRTKNVEFGTTVMSSVRMMHTLRFLENVLCPNLPTNVLPSAEVK